MTDKSSQEPNTNSKARNIHRRRVKELKALNDPEVDRLLKSLDRHTEQTTLTDEKDRIITISDPDDRLFKEVKEGNEPTLENDLKRGASVESKELAGPPKLAGFVVALLLNKESAEAALGDLEEQFWKDAKDYDASRARWFYWARALKSIWPLLGYAAERAIRWGFVSEIFRRFF